MTDSILVSPGALAARLPEPATAIFDCRFAIRDPDAGRRAYLAGHVPGARYLHLDDDLSGPIVPGKTGRHPLPAPQVMAGRFSAWGIGKQTRVVAYDDSGGSMAVRLWWLLRWLGHDACAVLDGGWQAWTAGAHPVETAVRHRAPAPFTPKERPSLVADARLVDRARTDPAWLVADARALERYRGENETIDPVAGHIPGAIPLPYSGNLAADGRFLPPAELARRYRTALSSMSPDRVICYCGSGVTAAHDAFAMVLAGLGDPRLYPGSWSEWITDPARPVVTGAERG